MRVGSGKSLLLLRSQFQIRRGKCLSPLSVVDKARNSCFKEQQGWFRIRRCLLGHQNVYRDWLGGDGSG